MSAPIDRFHLVGSLVADRYRIDEVISESPLSLDYRGTDHVSGGGIRLTVLKVLGEFTKKERRAILDRLLATADAVAPLARLDAAISGATDAGAVTLRDGNWVPYLAQPFFAGASLDEIRSEEKAFGLPPRTLAQAMQLLGPAARALGLAASKGLVHGGLTPSCIALLGDPRAPDPQLRISDWGLARAIHEARTVGSSSVTGSFTPSFFHPRFAAPEQIESTGQPLSAATDVFSFALVVAYMLTYPPDDAKLAKDLALARATPGRRGAAMPLGSDAIFARALSRDPAARPPTVAAFWEALTEVRGAAGRPSSIPPAPPSGPRPPPSSDRLVKLPPARPDDKTIQISALSIPKPPKRRGRGWIFWALFAIVVASAAGWLAAREYGLTSRLRGLFSASP